MDFIDLFQLLVVGLIPVVIAVLEYRENRLQRRVEEFRINHRDLSRNRFEYSEANLESYRREVGSQVERGIQPELCVDYLIHSGDWCVAPVPTDRVRLHGTDGRVTYPGPRSVLPYRGGYTYNVKRILGKSMFNGTMTVIRDVSVGDSVDIYVGESDYYTYYDLCEYRAYRAVYDDVVRLPGGTGRTGPVVPLDRLTDWDSRPVGIGVCTLTVLHNIGDGTLFCVHHRSDRLAEAMNTTSLVPAGSLQIALDEIGDGGVDHIGKTILREFVEEFLNCPEIEYPESFDLDMPDSMRTYYLTMGFDPLNTKMEMVTMLVIDCAGEDLKPFLSRFSDVGFGDGPLTMDELSAVLAASSYEGDIEVRPFDMEYVLRHMRDRKAMPVFREAMRYVSEHHAEMMDTVRGSRRIGS